MNLSFYTAAVGAYEQQQRMNIQSNNIANVNTYGYKAQKASFQNLMYGTVTGIDGAELPRGTGARMMPPATDFSFAGLADTGRTLDFAIEGEGFFALYDNSDGEISFTRDGSFLMSQFLVPPDKNAQPRPDGAPLAAREVWRLSDGEGRCVLDSRGNFIEITDVEDELDVGVFDLAAREGMLRAGSGRFLSAEKNGQLYLGEGRVKRGFLERSNADLADQMMKVIESQRAYSYALKMVQTSDEIETTINGLRG
jgi:flagellar basal-body rod protein FlgG